MNTLEMVTKSKSRGRILSFLNSLALARPKTARTTRCCSLCALPITAGEQFRDRWKGRAAHEFCFQAVRREFK